MNIAPTPRFGKLYIDPAPVQDAFKPLKGALEDVHPNHPVIMDLQNRGLDVLVRLPMEGAQSDKVHVFVTNEIANPKALAKVDPYHNANTANRWLANADHPVTAKSIIDAVSDLGRQLAFEKLDTISNAVGHGAFRFPAQ